jgi:two-component system cell cycle sensor histidine kinase/response regulator CckA
LRWMTRRLDMSKGLDIETILIVDDEEFIRGFLAEILTSEGYRVILASDGIDALEKYQEHLDSVNLVLMDIGMPNKDGIAACMDIFAMNPHQKIILMSAYFAKSLGDLNNIKFIQKPMQPSELFSMLREVLDS